jgi:hypothetical protein
MVRVWCLVLGFRFRFGLGYRVCDFRVKVWC